MIVFLRWLLFIPAALAACVAISLFAGVMPISTNFIGDLFVRAILQLVFAAIATAIIPRWNITLATEIAIMYTLFGIYLCGVGLSGMDTIPNFDPYAVRELRETHIPPWTDLVQGIESVVLAVIVRIGATVYFRRRSTTAQTS